MVVAVLTIHSCTVHRLMVHDNDPGTLGTLSWFRGSLQILLDPTILFTNQIQSVPQKEVEFSVYADNVSRTYVPTECGENNQYKVRNASLFTDV